MAFNLFGQRAAKGDSDKSAARVARVSSGWTALLKDLRAEQGERVLDVGPTSSTNINFLTDLGHSVYMADLLGDLTDAKWPLSPEGVFPVEEFVAANLQFNDRRFETVLFWDTGDYLPPDVRDAVISRICDVMEPGGKLLAFFHSKPDHNLHRYHLRADGSVDTQLVRTCPMNPPLNNRQIEGLFQRFQSHRFFLAKDDVREVLVTR